ncbi:MAG: RNA-binding cell elongation regulator Jag/EloR [Bacilli bacterium]|jgi:spoIIIJ-associated protein
MKTYTAKNLEEAIKEACQELNIEEKDLLFEIQDEKKGLFSKKAVINVYEIADVIDFAKEYVITSVTALGLTVEATASYQDEIIHITINSDHNPILIGKNGRTLQSLNELVKLAVNARFKRRFRILLDVNDYKNVKYSRIIRNARIVAKQVQKSKVDVKLDPMTPDERRIVHNALSEFSHIKTESEGDGQNRAIVIKYIE